MKKMSLLLCAILLVAQNNFGEINQTFSNTLMFVIGHASSDFSMLRGSRQTTTAGKIGERYASKGKVIGARWNEIVHDAAGWHYEGLLYEGEPVALSKYYQEYEHQLREPMRNAGYTRVEQSRREAGPSGEPDLVFTWKTGSPVVKLVIVPGAYDGVYQLLIEVMK